MAERPRRTLVGDLLTGTGRLCNRRHADDQINQCKHTHRHIEHDVDIVNLLAGQALTDDSTHQHRRQRARQRVQRAAHHIQLVTAVAAATQQVQHRVNDRIEHTHAETADESAGQIDIEAIRDAAEPLYENTDEAQENSRQRSTLVAELSQEITGRNTHNQVRKEIEQVTQHTHALGLGRVIKRGAPDLAHRSSQIRYKRNHRVEKHHRDDGNHSQ